MPVAGIANFVQSLADQSLGQTQNAQAGANRPGTGNALNATPNEDTFTPTAQNNSAQGTAQDAGIFQVSQGAPAAVAANVPYAQTTLSANQNGAPAQAASVTTTNTGNGQPAAAASSTTTVNAGQIYLATPAAQTTAATAVATTNVQEEIQALNNALPTLGLSKEDIQEIDRIAALIQDFNPGAYTNLVNQFEAQAQQTAQQSTGTVPANASTVASPKTAASANGSGSQV
jgi:hypothetical protein